MTSQVIIIMGSKSDLSHAQLIVKTLMALEISYQMRICSAHKATRAIQLSPARHTVTALPVWMCSRLSGCRRV